MSGPTIKGLNSSFGGVGAFSLPGVLDPSQTKPLDGASKINQPGAVPSSEHSAEVPRQAAINRELLSKQLPALAEIAFRGQVSMPQPATALKEIKALVKNHTVPKETYKQLEKCSKEFTKNFQALCKMKVSDVQAMFNSSAPTRCSKIFNAIDQCFGNIDEQLLSLINNPETRSGNIERLQEDCALMYSRLRTALMSCAEGNLDPKATIASIVTKVATSMSGSAGVLEAVKDEIAPILTGLANAEKPDTDTLQIGRMIADAEQALAALERVKTEGVQVGNGRTIPMQSDMDALIGTLKNAITNVRQQMNQSLSTGIERAVDRLLIKSDSLKNLSGSARDFFKSMPKFATALKVIEQLPNPIESKNVLEMAKTYTPAAEGKPAQSELLKAIRDVNAKVVAGLPGKQLVGVMNLVRTLAQTIDRRSQLGEKSNTVKAWNVLSSSSKKEVKNTLNTLFHQLFLLVRTQMMDDELSHLEQMMDVYNGKASGQIRQSDYKTMLSGDLDVGTVMLTYASGLNHHHMDKEVCNAQLTKSKLLGSGQANDVQLLTYKGTNSAGQTVTYNRVFKPALEARIGLHTLVSSSASGYLNTQNAVQTNVGASYIAEQIGAKDILTTSRFGVVNGVPGIMMDQAKGIEAYECRRKYGQSFSLLSNDMKNTVRGNLMRELNRLQWADILSGQMDRHNGNFMVKINFDTLDVRVTGIDNDVCCGQNMVGMRTIRLEPARFESVFENPTPMEGVEVHTEGEPPKATEYICDMSKMSGEALSKLMKTVGGFAMCLPTAIDAETARNIENINIDTYTNDLRGILQDEESVQAAVSRLKDAKAYIKELAAQGKVIDTDSWGNADTQKKIVQGQQEQANKILSSIQSEKDAEFTSNHINEFFWDYFPFMSPSEWKLPNK